jgi:hypothetical protein
MQVLPPVGAGDGVGVAAGDGDAAAEGAGAGVGDVLGAGAVGCRPGGRTADWAAADDPIGSGCPARALSLGCALRRWAGSVAAGGRPGAGACTRLLPGRCPAMASP